MCVCACVRATSLREWIQPRRRLPHIDRAILLASDVLGLPHPGTAPGCGPRGDHFSPLSFCGSLIAAQQAEMHHFWGQGGREGVKKISSTKCLLCHTVVKRYRTPAKEKEKKQKTYSILSTHTYCTNEPLIPNIRLGATPVWGRVGRGSRGHSQN